MALASITDLTAAAANSSNPFFVPPLSIGLGGIDPLGLRQINFDLMDKVLPGLNNVARHVRPFVVVTWAWHRAAVVAREQGRSVVKEDQILDFVDRVDVIYVWSQFLRDANADLPGRQVLDPLIHADRWVFDGPNWHARRKVRRLSTALMAPINYGPALKTMGWIEQHQYHPNVFLPSAAAAPAVAAFEHQISGFINAPAFNRFGPMDVAAADVGSWAEAWALDKPTEAERAIMRDMFMGSNAPSARRKGCNLMLAAARENADPNPELEQIRAAMAGAPSSFVPSGELDETQVAWRRVQVRQLFRLALEALLYWASLRLRDGAKMTNVLVSEFIGEYTEGGVISPSIEWLEIAANRSGRPDGVARPNRRRPEGSRRSELAAGDRRRVENVPGGTARCSRSPRSTRQASSGARETRGGSVGRSIDIRLPAQRFRELDFRTARLLVCWSRSCRRARQGENDPSFEGRPRRGRMGSHTWRRRRLSTLALRRQTADGADHRYRVRTNILEQR